MPGFELDPISWKSEDETPKSARRTVPSSAEGPTAQLQLISAETEEEQRTIDEEVGSLDIAVQPPIFMEVEQAVQSLLKNCRDHVLVEAVGKGVAGNVEK